MSSIVLQPQLSPEDKNYLPQMPFCESHLHHSFFPVYLHPSWVFSGSYMEGLHRKSTKPRYREPRLSEVTFYCCDCYCFLSISIFTFSLSIISTLFSHSHWVCFSFGWRQVCSWTFGFGEEVGESFGLYR